MTPRNRARHDAEMTMRDDVSTSVADAPGRAKPGRTGASRWLRLLGLAVCVVAVAASVTALVLLGRAASLHDYPAEFTRSIAFSLAGAIVLGYPKARSVGTVLLAAGFLASAAMLATALTGVRAGRWWSAELAGVAALLDAVALYLAWAVLPQVFPSGPLQGRRWVLRSGFPAVFWRQRSSGTGGSRTAVGRLAGTPTLRYSSLPR